MKIIEGSVCAPQGFKAGGVHAGIRKNKERLDMALIYSEVLANTASVYTTNLVKGAPIVVTKEHSKNGKAQAIVCNSGNANTCTTNGVEIATKTCGFVGEELEISSDDVLIASTGIIGLDLDIEPFQTGVPKVVSALSSEGGHMAAEAILTTDTTTKELAVEFEIGGTLCKIGGIAKGSGMIHPDMATMLCFITTDCAISSKMLQKALSNDVQSTFNMMSVDGDTSTNDMISILANGLAGNNEIVEDGAEFEVFMKALNSITMFLCKAVAGDGEGATKVIECAVTNGPTEEIAKQVAKSVICSSLVKTAIFGSDANWGRILCAIGYSKAEVDVTKIKVGFSSKAGALTVCENGMGIVFSEEVAKEVLSEKEIEILIDLNDGDGCALAWGCDLTYDYVKINGDYRS